MTTCPFKKAIALQEILRGGRHTIREGLAWFEHIEAYLACDEGRCTWWTGVEPDPEREPLFAPGDEDGDAEAFS